MSRSRCRTGPSLRRFWNVALTFTPLIRSSSIGSAADALRTDMRAFRKLELAEPILVELREWSRMADDLTTDKNRLANRLREQLWRYYPQMLELDADITDEWMLDLWEALPTPANRLRRRTM